MWTSVLALVPGLVTAGQAAPECSLLLKGKGYKENLNGQHVRSHSGLGSDSLSV